MTLKRNFGCLWALSLYLVTTDSLTIPSISDPRFIEECIAAHNEWRGRVRPPAANMKYMVWEDGLAKMARAWANKCQFKHNACLNIPYECYENYQFVGENIWLGESKVFSPRDAVIAWFNESNFYDFDSISCTKVCGHYTQVVWASSHRVGCAVKICPNLGKGSTAIFVCNYGPAGNYPNQHPYKKGTSCSQCSERERCVKKLCQIPQIVPDSVNVNLGDSPRGGASQEAACNLLSLGMLLHRMV
ncbi:GLIPR1-like protein 1 [Ochotona curzoniae]|uniref:GLIPR1-like protein 1 n=1 Tax=Ochotona curzoniae TaxID=130825 RepID=UPI001B34FFC6|nr:GLIPR1-like protein 1 [Ochotona curzoniae]